MAKKYILRVDDEPSVVRVFVRQYDEKAREAGATLLKEIHPVNVLETVEATHFEDGDEVLAVFDFNMPEMNGLELLRAMRTRLDPKGVRVQAVFYSGDPSGENQREIEAAHERFLSKPHDDPVLDGIVTEFLAAA